jgi:frataxin-like iron-binding protein CyaY
MTAAQKFGKAFNGASKAKRLMRHFEGKNGAWPQTKRAATLVDKLNAKKSKILKMEKNK